MIKELFFLRQPVIFQKGISIYPPSVSEVIMNPEFGLYSKALTQSQEEIEDLFTENDIPMEELLTPLEFLLNNCFNNKIYEELVKRAFLFFTKQEISFLYEAKTILIGNLAEILTNVTNIDELQNLSAINESNFFDFQNLIRQSCGDDPVDPPIADEHPKIKRMKALKRKRDKVKAQQNAKAVSFSDSLESICCMGLGLNPLNIGELSYYAFKRLSMRYQEKEKYELDIRTLLAGGDSKKIKPIYWIRKIED